MNASLYTSTYSSGGLVARLETALFTVTLAAIGYMYLGTLLEQAL